MESPDTIAGRAAARKLWQHWEDAGPIVDPRTAEFAQSALREIEVCQKEMPGVLKAIAQGALHGAQQLNVSAYHGIAEVLQNADDLQATAVKLGLRKAGPGMELLIMHDGEPVELPHVLGMSFAFLSTKSGDSGLKGKFGIGLKTLGRVAESLQVHSRPYHFEIVDQHIQPVPSAESVPDLYDSSSTTTLLILQLKPDFDKDQFIAWFESWSPAGLLFLDRLRQFELCPPLSTASPIRHRLVDKLEPATFEFISQGQTITISRSVLHDEQSGVSWKRFSAAFPAPKDLERSHKKTGGTSTVGIAVPNQADLTQQIFAGLPTRIATDLPICIDAQFDPATSRETLLENKWNEWLIAKVGTLWAEIAVKLFEEAPHLAWQSVPLRTELSTGETWLDARFLSAAETVYARLSGRTELRVGVKGYRLDEIGYEVAALDGLFEDADYPCLATGKIGVPANQRDNAGRWRDVLDTLGLSTKITIPDALLACGNPDAYLTKTANWFLDLVSRSIKSGYGSSLYSVPCLLTCDGTRVCAFPKQTDYTSLLVAKAPALGFATAHELVHVLDAQYFEETPAAKPVNDWLKSRANFAEQPTAPELLRIFAKRFGTNPLKLNDSDLLEIRAWLEEMPPSTAAQMGKELGDAILLDGFSWKGKQKVSCPVQPSRAYLPAAIDGDPSPWSKAAARTPGLIWLTPRYADTLKARRKQETVTSATGAKRKTRSVRSFLLLLGAEIAPRLTETKQTQVGAYRTVALAIQTEAFKRLPAYPQRLERDFQSPDTLAVVADISASKARKEREVRSAALFNSIARSWKRLYEERTTATAAYRGYRQWYFRDIGTVPASWLSQLSCLEWLCNLNGVSKAPRYLALKTPANVAIYGDAPGLFAYGLDGNAISAVLATALGMEAAPTASGIIDQLVRLRESVEVVNEARIYQLYRALSALCPETAGSGNQSAAIGDLRLKEVRAKFGLNPRQKGLVCVFGTGTPKWTAPTSCFLGPAIFHGRASFAPNLSPLLPLWRVLGIRSPSVADCLNVLDDIAREPINQANEEVLIETYRHLNKMLADAAPRTLEKLRILPLWCGDRWARERPIYTIQDGAIGRQLPLPVWLPPCTTANFEKLLTALRVTNIALPESAPIDLPPSAAALGEHLRNRFLVAVTNLQTYFARNDEDLYKAIRGDWERLRAAEIFVADGDALRVRVGVPKRRTFLVTTQAHMTRKPLVFYFASAEAIGQKDAGGHAIAACFEPISCQEKVALAWVWAWGESANRILEKVSLSETGEETLKELEQAANASQARASGFERGKKSTAAARTEVLAPSLRTLKNLRDLRTASVAVCAGSGEVGGYKEPRRIGLVDPPTDNSSGSKPPPTTSARAYTNEELEELAKDCLAEVLRDGTLGELRDLRALRGIGADAALNIGLFEIKSFGREAPNSLSLTRNEAERARREKDRFLLAIVSGLEAGHQTEVRLIPDPLKSLNWSSISGVTLSGIKDATALVVQLEDG